ncbi:thiosulfate sulfurtransferase GlpE [Methylocystis silviterrae]|uniref:thiosulfate sulfurtransferase GlpE n=1 Tax=Methylocystis silviterrae TaxID=2743612 RepID=UPI003C7094FC
MRVRAGYMRIGVMEAQQLIATRSPLVLDVRDAQSYARGHIPDAQSASETAVYGLLTSQPKRHPVLIYCYHGNASQTYAQTFVDFGFEEVFSLDGGFEHWRQVEGAPIAIPVAGGG